MLRRLVKHEIKCSYVLVNTLSYVIKHVSTQFHTSYIVIANLVSKDLSSGHIGNYFTSVLSSSTS